MSQKAPAAIAMTALPTQRATTQINGVSLTIFLVLMAPAIINAIFLDTQKFPEYVNALITVPIILVGLYSLFALKIANE